MHFGYYILTEADEGFVRDNINGYVSINKNCFSFHTVSEDVFRGISLLNGKKYSQEFNPKTLFSSGELKVVDSLEVDHLKSILNGNMHKQINQQTLDFSKFLSSSGYKTHGFRSVSVRNTAMGCKDISLLL